ncbi:MAG: Uma2 family endonuclease [Bacteroidota bacterium]
MDTLSPYEAPPIPTYPGRTMADFDALTEGTLAQLVDGTLLMSPAPSLRHQRIATYLTRLFGNFVEEQDLGAVIAAPVDVRLREDQAFQPDLLFVSHARYDVLSERGLEGAPDLVVEVLSPSTGYYDLTAKRRVYEQSGVREYWIVDPLEETVEVLALADEGYRTAVRVEGRGQVASVVLDGFTLDAASLFAPLR